MKLREQLAAVLALAVALPLVFLFARAFADGSTRHYETPLRALIGDASFEQLKAGDKTAVHYVGDDRTAPDFTLPDEHGDTWKLSEQSGKVVVMNFWSVTCPPCVEEMPALLEMAEILKDEERFEVVAVTTDQNWETVRSLFPGGDTGSLKILFDPERKVVGNLFGSRMFPETWVIDGERVIRLRVDGRRDWSSPLALDAVRSFL